MRSVRCGCSKVSSRRCSLVEDLDRVVEALSDGATAAVLVWENTWAAPFVAAARRSGGEVVASDRIPMRTLVDALDSDARPVVGRPVVRELAPWRIPPCRSRGIEQRNHQATADATERVILHPIGVTP